jgi:hypothetical protein
MLMMMLFYYSYFAICCVLYIHLQQHREKLNESEFEVPVFFECHPFELKHNMRLFVMRGSSAAATVAVEECVIKEQWMKNRVRDI